MEIVAITMLSIFTLAYLLHWVLLEPPRCQCLGLSLAFASASNETLFIVCRNAVLLGLLIWSLFRAGQLAVISGSSCVVEATSRRSLFRRKNAFTLLEMLFALAVVAVLLSLTLWGLSVAKAQSRHVVLSTRLRTHVQAFLTYASDSRGIWPLLADPRVPEAVFADGETSIRGEYFDATNLWSVPLGPMLYSATWKHEVFTDPFDPSPNALRYWYSGAFLASPAFFNPRTREGPSQWGRTGVADVLYPDRKALICFVKVGSGEQRAPGTHWGMVDGSAVLVRSTEAIAGYRSGVGAWPGAGWLSSVGPTGMVTIDGVRGRDRR